MGPVRRMLTHANNTFVGRVLIGPALSIGGFIAAESGCWHAETVAAGGSGRRMARVSWRCWPGLGASAGFRPGPMRLLFVYPGLGLALIRSFAEHQAEAEVGHRTAIVENAPVLGLLFLHNNLHVVHHNRPGLPWYEIPAAYRRDRERFIADNDNLVYRGYRDVALRHLLTLHHQPVRSIPWPRRSIMAAE